jgi:DNA replication licensing factor MCM5
MGNSSDVHPPYLRVLGLQVDGTGRFSSKFKPEEEQEFIRFSRQPNLYNQLAESIAPAVYGHEGIF